jgi:predicted amidophosphoribosyltransferase
METEKEDFVCEFCGVTLEQDDGICDLCEAECNEDLEDDEDSEF